MNNKPIPSIPNTKFMFKEDNQFTFDKNWKVGEKESNPTHKSAEQKNVNNEKFKAVFLIKTISPFGINNITSEPNKGKNINNSNILFL